MCYYPETKNAINDEVRDVASARSDPRGVKSDDPKG